MAKKNLNTFAKLFVEHCLTIRKDDRILPRATVEADGRLLVKDGTYLF